MEAKPKGAAAAASASKGKGNNNGGAGAAAKAREGASAQGAAEGGGRGGGSFRGACVSGFVYLRVFVFAHDCDCPSFDSWSPIAVIVTGGRGGERGRGRGDGRGPRSSIFGSSRGDRGGGFRPRRNSDVGEDGADGGSGGGEGAEGNPAERKERPKLQLKPRSKPLEAKEAAAEAARKPSIFGGGKPHDELEWTVRLFARSFVRLFVWREYRYAGRQMEQTGPTD